MGYYSTTYSSSYRPLHESDCFLHRKGTNICPLDTNLTSGPNIVRHNYTNQSGTSADYCPSSTTTTAPSLMSTNNYLFYHHPVSSRGPIHDSFLFDYNSDPAELRSRLRRLDYPSMNYNRHGSLRNKHNSSENVRTDGGSSYTTTFSTLLNDKYAIISPNSSANNSSSYKFPLFTDMNRTNRHDCQSTFGSKKLKNVVINSPPSLRKTFDSNVDDIPSKSLMINRSYPNNNNNNRFVPQSSWSNTYTGCKPNYPSITTNQFRTNSTDCSYYQIFNQIAKINNHLYLSSLNALSPERLRQLGITLLVSAVVDRPLHLRNAVNYSMHVPVEDIETANLRIYFDRVTDRIAMEQQRGGRALVHCIAGISRSSTLVMAYLMRYMKMSLNDAFHHVKQIRPYIQPNSGFWRQLLDYEEHLHGSRSVRIAPSQELSERKTYNTLNHCPEHKFTGGSSYLRERTMFGCPAGVRLDCRYSHN